MLKLVTPVVESMQCLVVLDLFQQNSDIFALPVVDSDNIPVGLVERKDFIEFFVKPFSKELNGKKKISDFMNTSSIIVDHDSAIDDVARIIVDAGMQHMVSGFIATENGQYIGVANGLDLLSEITQRKQANLFHLAHYDQLTHLPNRLLFLDRLDMAFIEARREKSQLGLLFIDLDNFKHFNDSMGHGFGDKLLVATAARLSSCARESDTVARLSGDEFTIMQEKLATQNDINGVCNRIVESMKQPLQIMGREVFITVSIGTALYPDDDDGPTGLLAKADAAMYEAKRNGRNTYRHYVSGMDVYSLDRMTLETDLRMALERNEFVLFYQPQIDLSTGKMVGNEALIRWQHPERGLLSPIHFIEITEETGLIIPIGKWVLQQSCRQHMLWVESGLEPMSISVNISAMQFYQTGFCEMVKSIIADSGMQPTFLELELTESLFMHDVDVVLKTLHTLHDLGVKLAIDDFGTGYSNLGYLKMFPIDKLKIDQSFIRHLEREPVNVDIVKAIAALGKSMSLELVAEGVETDDELTLVKSSGCDSVQGYRYSKPLPADQFELWINERNLNVSMLELQDECLSEQEAT
ncbi:MAG: EAL domain-containing protein [Methylobacter sp.]